MLRKVFNLQIEEHPNPIVMVADFNDSYVMTSVHYPLGSPMLSHIAAQKVAMIITQDMTESLMEIAQSKDKVGDFFVLESSPIFKEVVTPEFWKAMNLTKAKTVSELKEQQQRVESAIRGCEAVLPDGSIEKPQQVSINKRRSVLSEKVKADVKLDVINAIKGIEEMLNIKK